MEGGLITVRCLLAKIRYCQAKRKITSLESEGKLEEHNCVSVRSLERDALPLCVLFIDILMQNTQVHSKRL